MEHMPDKIHAYKVAYTPGVDLCLFREDLVVREGKLPNVPVKSTSPYVKAEFIEDALCELQKWRNSTALNLSIAEDEAKESRPTDISHIAVISSYTSRLDRIDNLISRMDRVLER